MKSKIAIKSIVLAVLILLSILQIEKLWFENNSNHSFFRYVPQKQGAEIALQGLILEPEYIAIYQGENKGEYYELDGAGILFNAILKDSGKLIRRLAQMQEVEVKYSQLFEKPHILCRFSIPMESERIGQIAKSRKAREDFPIYSMAIVPAGLEESNFMLLFFSEDSDQALGYSVSKADVQDENEVFTQYIGNKALIGETLLLSAMQQGLSGFTGEVLLPAQKQNYILPQEWSREVAFINRSVQPAKIETEKLTEYLFAFVKNPKILWNITEQERVRYGDSSILMDYNQQGVFLYQYVQEVDNSADDITIGEALQKTLHFLEKDHLLANQEIKLAHYEGSDRRHHFFFDYYFRGRPLIWNEELQSEYSMPYPMEIVIEKDQVLLYRRVLLQSDYLLQQGSRFQVNYEDVLNAYYQKQDREKVKDLYLGYFAEGNRIRLGWVLETAEELFLYPLPDGGGVK